MKIIPDTNVLIWGFLGNINPESKIISLAHHGSISLHGSPKTYDEFRRKINMDKFDMYFNNRLLSREKVLSEYRSLISIQEPEKSTLKVEVVKEDPTDDEFFRVALSVGSKIVVSNDKKHILKVGKYNAVRTLNAADFEQIFRRNNGCKLFSD